MLKISTRGQYALLVMADLAEKYDGNYIPLKNLAHSRNLSVKYLEQILIHLSKAGFISGTRGMNGGYKLTKKPDEYTIGEILRAIEGDLSPCAHSENPYFISEGTKEFWKKFESTINNYVDSITLQDLATINRNYSYTFEYNI
ncbi:MAG: Rrf2 family transcriptional regulator [Treponema sp.]|nr:Rrf2 family transcriptional regulator [Treponema sp.]